MVVRGGMPNNFIENFRDNHPCMDIYRLFLKNRWASLSGYFLLAVLLTTIFSGLLAPYTPSYEFINNTLTPPVWMEGGSIQHILGTDDIGRDVLSRLIYGLRYTFSGALAVVLITTLLGLLGGILSAKSTGLKSNLLNHFLDAFLSIPILLLAIIIATLMQPSLLNAILAVTLASLPNFIHHIYTMVHKELQQDYAGMLRLDGASTQYIIQNVILWRLSPQIIQLIARTFTLAIVDISALGFIALGAQPPLPEWGAMIRESVSLMYLAPWLTIIPGVALLSITLSVFIFSNGLSHTIEKYNEN